MSEDTTDRITEHAANGVLLAGRYYGLMEGIRGLLQLIIEHVFMVSDEASLLQAAERLQPSLVIVDLSFGASDVLSLLTNVRSRARTAKLLVLSVHDEPTVVRSAIAAGADGFVLKRALATDLMTAVETILSGAPYVSPAVPVLAEVGV